MNSADEFVFVNALTEAQTDLDALRERYDSDGNSLLDSADPEFAKFKLWQDSDRDGVSIPSEVLTLASADIQAFNLDYSPDSTAFTAAQGQVTVLGQSSYIRSDQSTGLLGDVVINATVEISTGSEEIDGSMSFEAEPGSRFIADVDTDWYLFEDFLLASNGSEALDLTGIDQIVLRGGPGDNHIEVNGWVGTLEIDGGGGEDTIVIHSATGLHVAVLDQGPEDQIQIIGGVDPNLFQIDSQRVDIFTKPTPDNLTPTPVASVTYNSNLSIPLLGNLKVTGGSSDDLMRVIQTTSKSLQLDGAAGGDRFELIARDLNTITTVVDSGLDDHEDTLIVNREYVFNNEPVKRDAIGTRLLFDESVEVFEVEGTSPILNLTGSGTIYVHADHVLINGGKSYLSQVTDLTITTLGNQNEVVVEDFPATLDRFTINSTQGSGDTQHGSREQQH